MTTIPNADLIRAVLDGKTVQHMTGMCPWYDMDSRTAILQLVEEPSESYRIKPDPAVKWVAVFSAGDGKICVAGQDDKQHAQHTAAGFGGKVLRLELDPDTLDFISGKTEEA